MALWLHSNPLTMCGDRGQLCLRGLGSRHARNSELAVYLLLALEVARKASLELVCGPRRVIQGVLRERVHQLVEIAGLVQLVGPVNCCAWSLGSG